MNSTKARKLRKEVGFHPTQARVLEEVKTLWKGRVVIINAVDTPRAKYQKAKKRLK